MPNAWGVRRKNAPDAPVAATETAVDAMESGQARLGGIVAVKLLLATGDTTDRLGTEHKERIFTGSRWRVRVTLRQVAKNDRTRDQAALSGVFLDLDRRSQ